MREWGDDGVNGGGGESSVRDGHFWARGAVMVVVAMVVVSMVVVANG